MKKKLIGLAIFWLGCVGGVMGQVTGKAFLYGKTDHSGIKVKFVAQSPTAKTDSVYTASNGSYSINVKTGNYKIYFSKEGYKGSAYQEEKELFLSTNNLENAFLLEATNILKGNIKGRLSQGQIYVLDSTITIQEEDTLIIEPGAKVYVNGAYQIVVYGKLLALGNIKDSISFEYIDRLFKKAPLGKWKGFQIFSRETGAAQFSYCHLSDAETLFMNSGGLGFTGNKNVNLKVENCLIWNNNTVLWASYSFHFISNTIRNCESIFLAGSDPGFDDGKKYVIKCNKIYPAKMYNNTSGYGTFTIGGSDTVIIENNLFDFQYFKGLYLTNMITIKRHVVFNNNLFLNTQSDFGINIQTYLDYGYFIVFKNNTVEGEGFGFGRNSVDVNAQYSLYSNNIFKTKKTGFTAGKIQYNLFSGDFPSIWPNVLAFGQKITTNANGDSVDTYYNLFQDPQFLNDKPPYLAPGSPAIGAGIDDQGNPTNIGFDPTGTCLDGYFTKEPPIVSADTNSISGIVHQGSGYMTDGVVMAINKSNNKTYITRIKAGGVFKADSLSRGNYLLYAVPNPATTSSYVPTFYVNKTDINQAVTIPLQWKIIDVDIYLAQKTNIETGTSKINGRFGYGHSNTDDTTVYAKNWFGTSPTPAGPIALSGNPCKNLPILLYNSAGQVVNSTISDTEGYFHFGQLAAGEYKVNGQRNGYITENNGRVQLTSGQTETTSFYLVKGQLLGLDDAELNNGSNSTVYPNPFKEEINIRGFRGQVLITDLTGSTFYSNPFFDNQSIPTEEWPTGIYLLKTGDKVQKILKQ